MSEQKEPEAQAPSEPAPKPIKLEPVVHDTVLGGGAPVEISGENE